MTRTTIAGDGNAPLSPLSRAEAEHLQPQEPGQPVQVQAHALPAHFADVLSGAQLTWGLAGAAIGSLVFIILAVTLEAGAWFFPGFAPAVVPSRSAAAVGGFLAGLGIGALVGSLVGLVLDSRQGLHTEGETELLMVDEIPPFEQRRQLPQPGETVPRGR